jgi:hypothetical protein
MQHTKKNPAAVALGKRKSARKAAAARENGTRGGRPLTTWQPIATAPRDDGASNFLCYWPAYTYEVGEKPIQVIAIATHVKSGRMGVEYFHDTGEWDDYGLQRKEGWPTHWMPLPLPPKERKSNE